MTTGDRVYHVGYPTMTGTVKGVDSVAGAQHCQVRWDDHVYNGRTPLIWWYPASRLVLVQRCESCGMSRAEVLRSAEIMGEEAGAVVVNPICCEVL